MTRRNRKQGPPKPRQRTKEVAGAPVQAPDAIYEPPPPSACLTTGSALALGSNDKLEVHLRCYKTRVVHFSMEQWTRLDGSWLRVARIDTSQTIHFHQFDRHGNELESHALIEKIPGSPEGQEIVHNGYAAAYVRMVQDWEKHLRRWAA